MFCDFLKTHYTMLRVIDLVNIFLGRASEFLQPGMRARLSRFSLRKS